MDAARAAASLPVSEIKDVRYTPDAWPQALSADIYQPAGPGPFPAIVMVHGGGWVARTRRDMHRTALQVARRGYLVMNVSYRLAPRWSYPAQLHDMQEALAWLQVHAAEYRARSDRVALWGYSAGGHLALLPALLRPGHPKFVAELKPLAVVAGGSPVDLSYYPAGPLTNALMGVSYHSDPQAWRDASPLHHVGPGSPPTFLYHGTFDRVVGANNSHALYAALAAHRVPSELYLLRGLGHIPVHFLPPVQRACEFLARYL